MKKFCGTNCKIYLISFFLPVAILSGVFFNWGAYPAGNNIILITDLYHQYVNYFSYWIDAVTGSDSLLYSWNAGLGSNFIGNVAYYAASPFLVFLLFFTKKYLAEAVMFLILLKIGMSGVTMSFFIRRKFSNLRPVETVLFSSFYALMSYNVIYYYNVMWLDGIIWLPIIILATDRILYKKKVALFTFLLALLFISNFYISFMIGVFVFLYFVTGFFQYQANLTNKDKIVVFSKFIGGTLVAAGIASFLTIPTYFQLIAAQNPYHISDYGSSFPLFDLVNKMFSGAYDSVENGTPNVYVGTFVWMLIPFYLLSRKISMGDKLRWGVLSALLVISMEVPKLNIYWHAGDIPNWFPYRYSFLFSFVLLIISLKAYQVIETLTIRNLIPLYLFTVSIVLVNVYHSFDVKINLEINIVFASLFFLALFIKLINYRKIAVAILIFYTLTELTFNTSLIFTGLVRELGGLNRVAYTMYYDYIDAVKELKAKDSTPYYRVATDINRTNNDSLHIGYSSFNTSSSMLNYDFINTIKALGLSTRKANYNKNGSTLFMDTLLGQKYIINKDKDSKFGYKKIFDYKSLHAYKNTYFFPIGYAVNQNLKEVNVNSSSNPFKVQNEIYHAISKYPTNLFTQMTPTKTQYSNATVTDAGGGQKYLIKINNDKPMMVDYVFSLKGNQELYTSLSTSTNEKSKVLVDGKAIGDYPTGDHEGILDLGAYKDKEITVELNLDNENVDIYHAWFYALNVTKYPQQISDINQASLHIDTVKGTELTGQINIAKNDSLLFLSIPWDEGWKIEVNKKMVQPEKVLGSFIGIPLKKGQFEIKMQFVPKGYTIGTKISLGSILLLLIIVWQEKKKKQEKGGEYSYE